MIFVAVCLVAVAASALTLLSGFGLGTLLLPAFALFFEPQVAVAATGIVHLLNNLFKLIWVGKFADRWIVLLFGAPALIGAGFGAGVLNRLGDLPVLARYELLGKTREVEGTALVVAVLIFLFAVVELLPDRAPRFSRRWLPAGGLLSGFFGGLSGHQGALRSAFLIQSGLEKRTFIGTGIACAVLIDLARLAVYGSTFLAGPFSTVGDSGGWPLIGAATISAFLGAYLGVRWMGRVTLAGVRRLVGGMLLAVAVLLGAGLI